METYSPQKEQKEQANLGNLELITHKLHCTS